MLTYPKIDTVYERNADHRVPKYKLERHLRRAEFSLPARWLVTEKIDGTNIRIPFSTRLDVSPNSGYVGARGRTDAAQIPPFLLTFLQETFTLPKLVSCFDPDTTGILFGEGYGARIQKGGGNYRSDVSFRLFDVLIFSQEDQSVARDPADDGRAWWLNWRDVEDVARKLSIETVPVVARMATLAQAIQVVEEGLGSVVAQEENDRMDINAEGVVARTDPLLFDRHGQRVMWKLKERDFA